MELLNLLTQMENGFIFLKNLSRDGGDNYKRVGKNCPHELALAALQTPRRVQSKRWGVIDSSIYVGISCILKSSFIASQE
jgi:hypothetical protein